MLYTLTNIPYSSLAAVMTEDSDQNTINTSKHRHERRHDHCKCGISGTLYFWFRSDGGNGHGYMMTALVYGIISIPLFLMVFFTSKENVKPIEAGRKFSFKEVVRNQVTSLNSFFAANKST